MQLDPKVHPAVLISSTTAPEYLPRPFLLQRRTPVEVGITSITKNQNHALALIPDEPPDKMPSIVHLSSRVKEIHNNRPRQCARMTAFVSRQTPGKRPKYDEKWSCQTTPIS